MKVITVATMLVLLISITTLARAKKINGITGKNISSENVQKVQSGVYIKDGTPIRESKIRIRQEKVTTKLSLQKLSENFLHVESVQQSWSGTEWENLSKDEFIYDNNNYNITINSHQWQNSAWMQFANNEFSYNVHGNLIEVIISICAATCTPHERQSYLYDSNHNETEFLTQNWNGSDWGNVHKTVSTYDSNNNLVEVIYQYWTGSKWMNDYRETYVYDSNNNNTEYLGQVWETSAWVNNYKENYVYDANNNNTEYLGQFWNGSEWSNESQAFYSYDANNNYVELITQHWDGSNWVNDYHSTLSYDNNNLQTGFIGQIWNGNNWEDYNQGIFGYDGNGNQTTYTLQFWDDSDWINEFRVLDTYNQVTDIEQETIFAGSYNLSNNYPNPFNPTTKINYTIPVKSHVSLKVFDLLGSEVAHLINKQIDAGSYEVIFDASLIPSGIYFYRLIADNYLETKKMLLIK